MTGLDWLLFLHVLSAVLLVGAMTAFWALVLATRPGGATLGPAAAGRLNAPFTAVVSAGTLGTVVFGVWLAIVHDGYAFREAWILASLALWAVGTEAGRRSGTAFAAGGPAGWRRGIVLHGASSAAVLTVLVLMVWKPGA